MKKNATSHKLRTLKLNRETLRALDSELRSVAGGLSLHCDGTGDCTNSCGAGNTCAHSCGGGASCRC